MALVLRILDEIPRTPLRRATSWCLFKKTADVSVDKQFRRTVARTPPPAFLFPDQRFQRPEAVLAAPPFSARLRRRRRCSRLGISCQAILPKKFCFSPTLLRGGPLGGGSGVSREDRALRQSNLSNFSDRSNRSSSGRKRGRHGERMLPAGHFVDSTRARRLMPVRGKSKRPKLPIFRGAPCEPKSPGPPRTARRRARRRYTRGFRSLQAAFSCLSNFLVERRSTIAVGRTRRTLPVATARRSH